MKSPRHRIVLLLISLFAVLLPGCSNSSRPTSPPTPSITPKHSIAPSATNASYNTPAGNMTPSPTETATPTAAPTPFPFIMPDLQDIDIRSICLEVKQEYPELDSDFALPITETTSHILSGLGFEVIADGTACKATLSIELIGTPLSERYFLFLIGSTGNLYYTGAELEGQMTLSIHGRSAEAFPFEATLLPPSVVSSDQASSEPEDAPFADLWARPLIENLSQIWGVVVYLEALDSPAENVRIIVDELISDLSPEEAETIPVWIDALASAKTSVSDAAAAALGRIGPASMPPLIPLLESEDETMRLNAIRALGEVGAEAVSTLIQALSHESESARYAASTALAKIGSDSVPALVVALGSDDEVLVIGSANTILQMPGHVDEAIPALIRCLERENIYVRIAVVNALGSQGSYAMVAVPHLIPLLGDADPLIKNVALAALMNITWKDFGDDPEIWEQWWDGRQQFDP
jgi:hypothetical protein